MINEHDEMWDAEKNAYELARMQDRCVTPRDYIPSEIDEGCDGNDADWDEDQVDFNAIIKVMAVAQQIALNG